jgi:Kef-type K+ transport system membrane component KefB
VENLVIASLAGVLILLASMASAELGLSVAIAEIALGVVGGNFLGLHVTPWMDFLASFASIVLTFMAGSEVDTDLLREKWKESLLLGGASFVVPFLAAMAFAYWGLHWTFQAAQITGIALSTTSLAVVYAVLVETGLNETRIGKIIMASTFVTDFATALALSVLFMRPSPMLIVFIAVSAALIFGLPRLSPWFFRRYGNRVTEPEIKLIFLALFVLMLVGEVGQSHAVLPAFLLGLAMARTLAQNRTQLQRLRVVAFSLLTPFFFLKSGMNVSLPAVVANFGILVAFLAVKLIAKFASVYPLARRYVPEHSWYTTLLMSTGLTFGTISSLYGLQAGILNQAQFSVLITTVIGTAVLPTLIAQRFFSPKIEAEPSVVVAETGRSETSITPAETRQRDPGTSRLSKAKL